MTGTGTPFHIDSHAIEWRKACGWTRFSTPALSPRRCRSVLAYEAWTGRPGGCRTAGNAP